MNSHLFVVDGHHVVRQGVARLLSELPDVAGVTEAASGEDALRFAQDREPDVVVLDLTLQGVLHGLDLIAAFHRDHPETRVVVLSSDHRRSIVEGAIEAGAHAYVSKTSDASELAEAIRAVENGRTFVSSAITQPNGANGTNGSADALGASLRTLSKREREVLALIARGGTTKSIAFDLGISPKTVEKHRAKLSRKLDIHSVATLTRFAVDNGIL